MGNEPRRGITISVKIPYSTDDGIETNFEVRETEQGYGPADIIELAIHALQMELRELHKCPAHKVRCPAEAGMPIFDRVPTVNDLEKLMQPR